MQGTDSAGTDREPCPICGYSRVGYNSDPMTLSLGSILKGRYAVGRVIGKDGFGIIYLAYDMKLEYKMAVKEYYPKGLVMRSPGSTFVSALDAESEVTFKEGQADFIVRHVRLQNLMEIKILSVYTTFSLRMERLILR